MNCAASWFERVPGWAICSPCLLGAQYLHTKKCTFSNSYNTRWFEIIEWTSRFGKKRGENIIWPREIEVFSFTLVLLKLNSLPPTNQFFFRMGGKQNLYLLDCFNGWVRQDNRAPGWKAWGPLCMLGEMAQVAPFPHRSYQWSLKVSPIGFPPTPTIKEKSRDRRCYQKRYVKDLCRSAKVW